jgi:hypothetical protein
VRFRIQIGSRLLWIRCWAIAFHIMSAISLIAEKLSACKKH